MKESHLWWLQRRNLLNCQFHWPHFLCHDHDQCQQYRMWCSSPFRDSSGQLELSLLWGCVECLGAVSSLLHSAGLSSPNKGNISAPGAKHHSGLLHKKARRESQSILTLGSRTNHVMGSEEPSQCLGSLCTWRSEHPSRLLVSLPVELMH